MTAAIQENTSLLLDDEAVKRVLSTPMQLNELREKIDIVLV